MTDEFSYTESGPALGRLSPGSSSGRIAALYNAGLRPGPRQPADPTANRAKADQIAVGALGLLDALVRLATAWMLLKIRHRGPGLWWSAICVTLALGVIFHPVFGIMTGGSPGRRTRFAIDLGFAFLSSSLAPFPAFSWDEAGRSGC